MGGAVAWRERPFDPAAVAALERAGVSPTLARLLASRGIVPEGLDFFFEPSLRNLASAECLPGVAEAVAVIAPFVRTGRKIVVFGDYDADGVCASAILVSTLKKLGGNADAFIPERFGEGYGMTGASLERLHREHPDLALVITVDNGITAAEEVARVLVTYNGQVCFTAYFASAFSAAMRSTSLIFSPTVLIQFVSYASVM